MALTVDFCGEVFAPVIGVPFYIGREADLSIDSNRFLHRRFLMLSEHDGVWMLSNVGTQLAATVSDSTGRMEAFLSPGAALPIVFEHTRVCFTAGPTTYDVLIVNTEATFRPPVAHDMESGETTIGATSLTVDQRRLIVSLAEPRLRGDGRASVMLPTSVVAAQRLGWTTTKFNRKLDNVCEKLSRLGVRGLHGDETSLASNRRARLVEYAIATRLVTRTDLACLEILGPADDDDSA